jgi:hypothetical protein
MEKSGSVRRKLEKVEKVKGSQDEGFVGLLKTSGQGCKKH